MFEQPQHAAQVGVQMDSHAGWDLAHLQEPLLEALDLKAVLL